jgi:hypothetical protein
LTSVLNPVITTGTILRFAGEGCQIAAGGCLEQDDPVPVFGSWRAIYTAVLVSAVVVMALVALFSATRY